MGGNGRAANAQTADTTRNNTSGRRSAHSMPIADALPAYLDIPATLKPASRNARGRSSGIMSAGHTVSPTDADVMIAGSKSVSPAVMSIIADTWSFTGE